MLDRIHRRLVVSCQPVSGGPMDRPDIVAAMAQAAVIGGAAGLRIEGTANLRAVSAETDVPIIGLVKRDLPDSPVRITPHARDARDLIAAGAHIVAVDATDRPRPVPLDVLLAEIKGAGALAMADCATLAEGRDAAALGFDLLGSTMSGYTGGAEPDGPDLALLRDLAALGCPAIAEGRYHTPAQAAAAIDSGAHAVVVGSALTRLEHASSWFADAVRAAAARAG